MSRAVVESAVALFDAKTTRCLRDTFSLIWNQINTRSLISNNETINVKFLDKKERADSSERSFLPDEKFLFRERREEKGKEREKGWKEGASILISSILIDPDAACSSDRVALHIDHPWQWHVFRASFPPWIDVIGNGFRVVDTRCLNTLSRKLLHPYITSSYNEQPRFKKRIYDV